MHFVVKCWAWKKRNHNSWSFPSPGLYHRTLGTTLAAPATRRRIWLGCTSLKAQVSWFINHHHLPYIFQNRSKAAIVRMLKCLQAWNLRPEATLILICSPGGLPRANVMASASTLLHPTLLPFLLHGNQAGWKILNEELGLFYCFSYKKMLNSCWQNWIWMFLTSFVKNRFSFEQRFLSVIFQEKAFTKTAQ